MSEWYVVSNANEISSPCLFVFQQRVIDNINQLKSLVADVSKLRPHVKTHKSGDVSRLLMQQGINKFKCATIDEARMLALAGAADILMAYQPHLPKAKLLLQLVLAYPQTQFACIADNVETVAMLSEVFSGSTLRVFLDINAGMNRTGVAPVFALSFYEACFKYNNIQVEGLHIYDGHIHDTDEKLRLEKAEQVQNIAFSLKQSIKENFGDDMRLVIGGTPTFYLYDDAEVSPGTFIYWDEGYRRAMPELPFSIAAVIMTRIISIVDQRTLCLDLGYKSVASENPLPRVKFLNAEDAVPADHYEEHMVVDVPDTSGFKVGDIWYCVPYHICPTVALYEYVYVVSGNEISATWSVAQRWQQPYEQVKIY